MKMIIAAVALTLGTGMATAAQFDYDYWTNNAVKPDWMPTSIKTDGKKTYIQFPDKTLPAQPAPGETTRAPSLVVMKTKQGDTSTWRYSVVDDRYEVDGVIEKAVLFGPSGDVDDQVLIQHGNAPATDTK